MERLESTTTIGNRFREPGSLGVSKHAAGERSRDAAFLPLRATDGSFYSALMPDWWISAVDAFRESLSSGEANLSAEIAGRIFGLTGRRVLPGAIYADANKQFARVEVDGISFRLLRGELALLARCGHCGVGEYASAPIAGATDLGYALVAWQPYCRDCEPQDPWE